MLLSCAYGRNAYAQLAYAAISPPAPPPSFPTPAGRTFNAGQDISIPFETAITPGEVIDYAFDWTGEGRIALQDGELVLSSSWTCSGLSVSSKSPYIDATATKTTVWLSIGSGVINESYIVTNQVKTSGGRTLECSFTVAVDATNFS